MYFFVRNNKEVTLAREEIMPFDRIFDNVGNGFNVSNATFTAPYNGTYQFSVTVMNKDNTNVHLQLMLNGEFLCVASAYQPKDQTGFCTRTVTLTQGMFTYSDTSSEYCHTSRELFFQNPRIMKLCSSHSMKLRGSHLMRLQSLIKNTARVK